MSLQSDKTQSKIELESKKPPTPIRNLFYRTVAWGLMTASILTIAPDLDARQKKTNPPKRRPAITKTVPYAQPKQKKTHDQRVKELRQIESYILEKTNRARLDNRLPSLRLDETLSRIAREHSEDMVKNNFFDHTNLRGENATRRAERNGYRVQRQGEDGRLRAGVAENINQVLDGRNLGADYLVDSPESAARRLVETWMASTGHRQNILNPKYEAIGIGVAYSEKLIGSSQTYNGICYLATQVFW